MKLRSLVVAIICTLGSIGVSAASDSSPALLDGINNGVTVLDADQSNEIRGEYFSSYAGMNDFCANNRDECDSKYYSYTKKKWAALDRRKWRTDVTRSF